ncbi:hypothetical protein FHS18_001470 [Paenibacillus phyllosphaerae]|uniref:Flagellar Assembly Protein A N-terminal region domain-containing protein n=1 Tax=Paenibacillus phyllosphaerae TaxID=274593 RepID=A0A7W5AVF1_9BACL|nr:FapA family protein [Paenibacillus phyllosphaerae]MBB3109418.1 hypothetical protein [Paenibacillus phyllosphaerae]
MSASELLESSIMIHISQDKLTAMLQFDAAADNLECTPAQLMEIIARKGVLFGIQTDVIEKIAKQPKLYMTSQATIAKGEPAQNGKDGYIQFTYDMSDTRSRPAELEDGSVDFKEITQLKNVKKGQLIAEKIPPVPGTPGTLVTGEKVQSKNGKEAFFKQGKNVVLSPDKMGLYAAIDGLITLTDKNKINVFPIYEIKGDVDYKVGNIDFVGTVIVRGNVLTGFRIRAAGDIRIIGGVEGAELEADGSVEITGGILASNKGHVRAGKNVKSSFIQDGNVTAAGDVIVSQSIMHSHVRAGQSVLCAGAKGLIVGGVVQAGNNVVARTYGNTMSTVTTIEVGVRPELREEFLELRKHLKETSDGLDKTEKALNLLDQLAAAGQLTPDKLALRIKLTATKRQAVDEIAQTRERILEIERSLEDTELSKVEVMNTIYGGSKIVIGRYTRFVKDPATRVTFRYSEGDIAMLPNT